MKKTFTSIILILLSFLQSFSQTRNNVRIYPCEDTLCYNSQLYIWSAGQSFNPISYLWSNGSTAPTINVTTSGVYSVTITGYLGSSNNQVQINKTKNVVVLNKPSITPLSETWVCKYDTVTLQADAGYTSYNWNNGQTNQIYSRQMTGSGGGPILDTVSVWYTASLGNLCQANSDTIVIRGIRRPNGVGYFYEGRTDLNSNDSVPAGLVLTYIYVPQYEMEFTKVNDPNYLVTWITQVGTRKAPLNILDPGYNYYVKTRPIINGVTYCWGETSLIGILPNSNPRVSNFNSQTREESIFNFYDIAGRFIFEKKGFDFNNNWLLEYPNQLFIITEINGNNISTYKREFIR